MGKAVKYIVIAAALLIVAGLFATGRFSKDEAKQLGRSAYYRGKGAVGGLLDGPASNSYEAAAKCRDNLRLIESAKRKAAQTKGQLEGALTVQEVERAFGRSLPACPSGGRYTIGPLIQLPACTILGNGSVDPGDDHVLKQY